MPAAVLRTDFLTRVSAAVLIASMGWSTLSLSVTSMFVVSVAMLTTCGLSAAHLFGTRAAVIFVALAIAVGFFAEYTGSEYGWFFGDYDFTSALGTRWIGVPIVIPMMWFSLCYVAYVIANLLVCRAPLEPTGSSFTTRVQLSFLAAVLVTAYDLAADPYMVFVVKAWIMTKQDGAWFGETVQGFAGWAFIAFVIILGFRLLGRTETATPREPFRKRDVLVPVGIYFAHMCFQVTRGYPVETRTISLFAMGIPLLILLFSSGSWRWDPSQGRNVEPLSGGAR